ncbi:MAG: hypothetical protein BWK80_32240 [Desulfobacteraceae bacterium IS3]|nr:MAG: hypothetical protein BWK80_32240 [Desulfobacteraceae bacterium IS3]
MTFSDSLLLHHCRKIVISIIDIFGNKRCPLFIKTDIKIGLAKDAESAKLLKIAEPDIFCLSSFALSAPKLRTDARTFFLFPKMSNI